MLHPYPVGVWRGGGTEPVNGGGRVQHVFLIKEYCLNVPAERDGGCSHSGITRVPGSEKKEGGQLNGTRGVVSSLERGCGM